MPRLLPLLCLALLVGCGGERPAPTAAAAPTASVAAQPSPSTPTLPLALPTPPATPSATEPSATEPSATEPSAIAPTPSEGTPTTAAPTEAATAPPPPADPTQLSLRLLPIASGLGAAVGVTALPDSSGRLVVVDKRGFLWLVGPEGTVSRQPLLDVSTLVSTGSEQGLLGIAFEPGGTGRFYINYTDRRDNTQIVRYRLSEDPAVADPASAETVLSIAQPAANHNGGHLLFGPDGMLWIGLGDGGAAADRFGNGQNAQTLLGSMLRLDVSGPTGYTVPADNPFVGGGGAPEVWAIGLRNPWRYSFDRATGELWIADVGQNAIEEVSRVASEAAGLNFGWPILEGTECFLAAGCSREGMVLPVTQYSHAEGCSISGGYVYRGAAHPTMQGLYLFSDYCSGTLWAIPADAEGTIAPTPLLETALPVSAFGEDAAGELYLTSLDGGLYRLSD